jgi:hypothetical protein
MATATRLILLALLAACGSGPVAAESAYDQAKALAGPNYRPPDLPTPQMQCETCGSSRSVTPRTTTRSAPARTTRSAPAISPGATLGAAIFGSLLQQALSFEPDDRPDPAEQARQEAARRQAEEEAKRRAAEEEARHRALLASLKAVPLPSPSAPAVADGLGLKALAALDAPQSAESLRDSASLGWDTPRLRLAVRFQPIAVSAALPVHAPQTVCTAAGCRWPAADKPVAARIATGPARLRRPDTATLADLLAAARQRRGDPREPVIAWMAEQPPQPGAQLVAQWRRLRDQTRQTVIALFWALGGQVIEAVVPGGKMITLGKDVYELTDQSLLDAAKVAGWLGSADLDAPPEIVSVEEAAKPFLSRGFTEQELIPEIVRDAYTVLTEADNLAKKLMSIWELK